MPRGVDEAVMLGGVGGSETVRREGSRSGRGVAKSVAAVVEGISGACSVDAGSGVIGSSSSLGDEVILTYDAHQRETVGEMGVPERAVLKPRLCVSSAIPGYLYRSSPSAGPQVLNFSGR